MKKYTLILPVLVLAGCSSSPVATNDRSDDSAMTVSDAPPIEGKASSEDVKPTPEPERPKAPPVVVGSSQYSNLNAAVKAANDEAIYRAATDILAQASNDPRALNALAMYHYKRGRFDLSRYLLTKALSANPKSPELYSNLGIVQLAQNERREAIKSFRKALEINRDDAVASSNLGAIYVQEKDYNKGVMVLETAYRKGIRDGRVLNNYAIALTAQGKFDKAADLYKGILKENNGNREAMYNYAVLLIDRMAKYEDGLEIIGRLKFVGGPGDTRNKIIALENKAKAGLK
ncbi:MAG: tetratricopeptide repeat protein [Bacillota bacterium]